MTTDAELLLINRDDVDSGNDGNGSGADPTAAAGAVVDLDEGATVAAVLHLGEPGATAAGNSDTCDVIVQVSPDGGSTYGPAFTFRQVLGSEVNTIDESQGGKPLTLAGIFKVPRAASGQGGKVKCRLNIVISATEHFAIYGYITDPGNVKELWYDNAAVNA